jgi:DNA repair protein RecO (recombination protein O)
MRWSDEGYILSIKKHGESSLITAILTKEHGIHNGISRKNKRNVIYQGMKVSATWSSRLEAHLGSYSIEVIPPVPSYLLKCNEEGLFMASVMEVLRFSLPERQVYENIYLEFEKLNETIITSNVKVEIFESILMFLNLLLQDLGYPLDLHTCCVTGSSDDLTYISPKSGRAVSKSAGKEYSNRLLTYPKYYQLSNDEINECNVKEALKLTYFFIIKRLVSRPEIMVNTNQIIQKL